MPGLAQFRRDLSAGLEVKLGKTFTLPDASEPLDAITRRPALIVARTQIEPVASAPLSGVRVSTFELTAVFPQGSDDDRLEDGVEAVLEALESIPVLWSTAKRGVYADSYPAYIITIPATTTTKEQE